MATSKEHALRSYRRDLTSTFPSASALDDFLFFNVEQGGGEEGGEEGGGREVNFPTWQQAEAALQKQHRVPGGLSDAERAKVYEEHASELVRSRHPRALQQQQQQQQQPGAGSSSSSSSSGSGSGGGSDGVPDGSSSSSASPPKSSGPVRVDVSDLGLSMDDLSGPMGGFA